MKRVFITYSHKDSEFVDELIKQLDFSSLHIVLDRRVLKPGDSLLKIFEEIGYSSFLAPVLSRNSMSSKWVQKELRVAIVKEIDEEDFRVVPIIKAGENWEKLREVVPADLTEVLRDKFMARFDKKSQSEAIKSLLAAFSSKEEPSELYARIQGPQSDNPFRRVRTEYFEDLHVIARCFAEPETVIYDRIVEVKPTLVEGGRGSGKTMILKSLETRVSVYRRRAKSFADAQLSHFGAYCRLTQGAFSTQERYTLDHVPEDVATRLFSSELILRLIQSLVEELEESSKQEIIKIGAGQETTLVQDIARQVRPTYPQPKMPGDFLSLRRLIQRELRMISDYVGRRILGESPPYEGVFLGRPELTEVCSSLISLLPDLKTATIYFLLDEYENLLPFQKVVLNTLLKWSASGCFTIKVATKKAGYRNPQTLEGQELEESHDYTLLDLDYDISNQEHRVQYRSFLKQICEKTLRGGDLQVTDIEEILENRDRYDGLDRASIGEVVAGIVKEQSGETWEKLQEKEKSEYLHRLEVGALYRLKKKRKLFAGFDDFILLSSGIVRYFLELCGMSYYFAVRGPHRPKGALKITCKHQTDAAYVLSSYYLGTISKNIARHGPKIQQLAIDLGDVFRQKLLNHLSEPEAARLSITDPHTLEDSSYEEVRRILDVAEMHSVLQVPRGLGGIRPKHATEVQPLEYLLNRVYAPVLQFSSRPRWRTNFKSHEVKDLLDANQRQATKAELMRRLGAKKEAREPEAEGKEPTLFD
jgi:hypothetical protein